MRVRHIQSRHGVMHFRVKGKRGKIRFVPVHAMAQRLIEEYMAFAGHGADSEPQNHDKNTRKGNHMFCVKYCNIWSVVVIAFEFIS